MFKAASGNVDMRPNKCPFHQKFTVSIKIPIYMTMHYNRTCALKAKPLLCWQSCDTIYTYYDNKPVTQALRLHPYNVTIWTSL